PQVDDGHVDQSLASAAGEGILLADWLVKARRRLEAQRESARALVHSPEEILVILVLARPIDGKAKRAAIEHRGEEVLELRGEEHRVDPGERAGFLWRREVADEVLAPRVGRTDEEDLLARAAAGQKDEDRLGLLHARQVEQIAILPVFIVDVARVYARRRAPQNGHRAPGHRRHQPRAAGFQIVAQRGGGGRGGGTGGLG